MVKRRNNHLYVLCNSDVEDHATKRFPHKSVKHVGNRHRRPLLQLIRNFWLLKSFDRISIVVATSGTVVTLYSSRMEYPCKAQPQAIKG